MTAKEKEKIKRAIKLINTDQHWQDGMDILFTLVGLRKPSDIFKGGKNTTIDKLPKKESSFKVRKRTKGR